MCVTEGGRRWQNRYCICKTGTFCYKLCLCWKWRHSKRVVTVHGWVCLTGIWPNPAIHDAGSPIVYFFCFRPVETSFKSLQTAQWIISSRDGKLWGIIFLSLESSQTFQHSLTSVMFVPFNHIVGFKSSHTSTVFAGVEQPHCVLKNLFDCTSPSLQTRTEVTGVVKCHF